VNDAIDIALDKASEGQQILWIENSVNESQKIYLELAARARELDVECGLLHSRFTFSDRVVFEEKWVNLYGKNGWPARGEKGRILIGTQILEQSLDLDADYLITNFAPSSMLLQRLGRLWRHSDCPRASTASPSALVIAPEFEKSLNNPSVNFGTSASVYEPYLLCRSLEVWKTINQVSIPSDIRTIVENTYSERRESGRFQEMKHQLREGSYYKKGQNAQEQLARLTLSESCSTSPESKAKTRYSEIETIEVLIVRSLSADSTQKSTIIKFINEDILKIPWDKKSLSKKEWKKIASRLMTEILTVNIKHAPDELNYDILKKTKLSNCLYIGNPEFGEDTLRIAILKDDTTLKNYNGAVTNNKYTIEYRNDLGYRLIQK
jgi:CRISPR-associated endonuclease/helicase Cas3